MANSKYDMTFEIEEQEYVLLNPGEYDFTIDYVKYGDYNGSAKIPACGSVTVYLHVDTPEGVAYLNKPFYVCKECAGLIASLFKCVGDIKDGQKTFKPDWDGLEGKTGRVKTTQREYNGNMYNSVDRFLAPKKKPKKSMKDLEW